MVFLLLRRFAAAFRFRRLDQDDFMNKTVPLTLNRDFVRIYKRGKSFVTPSIVLYVFKNKLEVNRLGITTGKKIGKAVKRNRARRIIREAYRALEPNTKAGYDLVFVARVRTVSMKTGELQGIIKGVLTNAGVLLK